MLDLLDSFLERRRSERLFSALAWEIEPAIYILSYSLSPAHCQRSVADKQHRRRKSGLDIGEKAPKQTIDDKLQLSFIKIK